MSWSRRSLWFWLGGCGLLLITASLVVTWLILNPQLFAVLSSFAGHPSTTTVASATLPFTSTTTSTVPPPPLCTINLVHVLDNATKGSKPLVLQSIRSALQWARSQNLLAYTENAPLEQWDAFSLNLVMNFQCETWFYDRLNYSMILLPSAILPVVLNYSNVALWPMAWDQLWEWGMLFSSFFFFFFSFFFFFFFSFFFFFFFVNQSINHQSN
jgi:hypothetical protein